MLTRRKLRRTLGGALVVAGALFMLFAPQGMFGVPSVAGLVLLAAGVVLELIGIALERRKTRSKAGSQRP